MHNPMGETVETCENGDQWSLSPDFFSLAPEKKREMQKMVICCERADKKIR